MSSVTAPDAAVDVEWAVLHDARAIHDVALLHFDDYRGGLRSWILAEVAPGPTSGSGTIPGGYIDGDTGKLIVPAGARMSTIETGTWRVVAPSSAAVHPSGESYSWYQPIELKRFLLPEDWYSPFSHGGSILFVPVAGKTDREHFGAVCLMFPDWAESVGPAFAFHDADPRLLDKPEPAAAAKLMELVGKPNPLLAVVAFRNLLELGVASPEWLRAQLLGVSGHRGAVFGYLTIITARPNTGRPFAEETLQIVDTASESTLRSLVFAACAALLVDKDDSLVVPRADAILLKARQRLAVAGVTVDKDPELSWILRKTGG